MVLLKCTQEELKKSFRSIEIAVAVGVVVFGKEIERRKTASKWCCLLLVKLMKMVDK